MPSTKKYFFFALALIFFNACKSTKYLQDDQLLYNGAKLVKVKPKKDQPKAALTTELSYKIIQSPNKKIFGQRFKLWVYQKLINHTKEKGFRHFLKTKIGEPPAIYNHHLTERSRLSIQQSLRDNGFLNASVSVDTTIKNKIINVKYTVRGNGRFFINNYILPPDTTELLRIINKKIKKPLIQSGNPYSLSSIDAERLRIESLARNNGFFEFDQSSLYFYLDTTIQEHRKLDMYVSLSAPANQKNFNRYQLGNINIYPDYSLSNTPTSEKKDTIREEYWQLIQNKEVVKLSALQEAIAQDSGAVYSQKLERQAINYLLDFGVFKYVNLKYEKVLVDSQPVLNRNFYLSPSLNQDFGLELEASTERTNFLGYSVGVNYIHRNIFRGAERFKTSLSLGAETQAGDEGPFVNTLEVNYDAGLSIPRLLLPFKITSRLRSAIPKTLINVNGTFQQRNTLFTSASALAELGYAWKQKQSFQHQFYPFQFTLLRLLSTSDDFEKELLENPRLRASFDDLLILATNYRFSFSNQLLNNRKNYFYFRGELETAGNVASLIASPNPDEPDDPKTFLNIPIAQFARAQAEARYTWYQPKTSVVARLATGYALPYGNSDAVPYIRQFFVGGASSNRGFRFRGVGPGSYAPDEGRDTTTFAFFDRVGDIRLEANVEYRFPLPISEYLKGAIFFDAGNVWLSQKSGEELPEGKFEWDRFYKELALGAGFGLRVDVQYVIIRFDFGIPLKDPSLAEGERWLIKDIQPGSKNWRNDNLKFNLAIGYPF